MAAPAMTAALLVVEQLSKSFGAVVALSAVSCRIARGERVAVIGPNGAGKTTLFNVIGGQLRADAGTATFADRRITGLAPHAIARLGLGRTFQVAATFTSMTVLENVQVALLARHGVHRTPWRSARTLHRAAAQALLDRVGIGALGERACATLAYVDLKRVELAIALALEPRLLLMDEPTAGMAAAERAQLMALVSDLAHGAGMALLFTEHDMDIVFAHADRIIVLNRGRLIADGVPAAVRANPEVRAVYLGTPAPRANGAHA
jgi:branched-chain amino acid transport system ATP-binding protein